jgi:hypothetical protein
MLLLQQTPQFQARFPGLTDRVKNGYNAITPADYINYENEVRYLEHTYNMPKGALQGKIAGLVANDVDTKELDERIVNGYAEVVNAPPEVRAEFARMWGVQGDQTLLNYMVDPTHTTSIVTQQAAAASMGGTAVHDGITLNSASALRAAQLGITSGQATNALGEVSMQKGLFDSNIGESQIDAGKEGFEAALGIGSTLEVQQRQEARRANFSQTGAAEQGAQGISGAGTARPV